MRRRDHPGRADGCGLDRAAADRADAELRRNGREAAQTVISNWSPAPSTMYGVSGPSTGVGPVSAPVAETCVLTMLLKTALGLTTGRHETVPPPAGAATAIVSKAGLVVVLRRIRAPKRRAFRVLA